VARSPTVYRPHSGGAKAGSPRYDRERGSAASRGYDRQWIKASRQYRSEHPLCEYCEMNGLVTATALVDHLYPHKGDTDIFWLRELWVSSCTTCHSEWKQQVEQRGVGALDALARRLGRPTLAEAMQRMHG